MYLELILRSINPAYFHTYALFYFSRVSNFSIATCISWVDFPICIIICHYNHLIWWTNYHGLFQLSSETTSDIKIPFSTRGLYRLGILIQWWVLCFTAVLLKGRPYKGAAKWKRHTRWAGRSDLGRCRHGGGYCQSLPQPDHHWDFRTTKDRCRDQDDKLLEPALDALKVQREMTARQPRTK